MEFLTDFEPKQADLRGRILSAQRLLPHVAVGDAILSRIAELCLRLEVDGHRGELTIARAARALAAFEGRRRVTIGDLPSVAHLALRHRLGKDSLGEMDPGLRIERVLSKVLARETEVRQ
jgi:magnesium chelatase subunit I